MVGNKIIVLNFVTKLAASAVPGAAASERSGREKTTIPETREKRCVRVIMFLSYHTRAATERHFQHKSRARRLLF